MLQFPAARALLFDLDGTLVDSVPDIAVAVDRLLADLGRAPAGETRVRFWVGNGGRMLVRRALAFDAAGVADDDPLLPRAMDIFFAHYNDSNGQSSRLYTGVAEALEAFAARGLPWPSSPTSRIATLHRCLRNWAFFTTFRY